jgi:hypothetical protein
MLSCNVQFNQLPRRSGCYVVTCSIHICELPSCSGCYVVTSVSINFQDALDTTLYQPCEATSRTLWMLRSNICFSELPRRAGCCVVPSLSSIVQDASMFEGSLAQKNFDKIQHLVLEAVSAAWYGLKLLSSIIAVGGNVCCCACIGVPLSTFHPDCLCLLRDNSSLSCSSEMFHMSFNIYLPNM